MAEATAAIEGDQATVTCEFCGRSYGFDRIDIAGLFALPSAPGPSTPQ